MVIEIFYIFEILDTYQPNNLCNIDNFLEFQFKFLQKSAAYVYCTCCNTDTCQTLTTISTF